MRQSNLTNFEGAARIPASALDEDIIEMVVEWIELLAEGEFKSAYDFTVQDPYYAWSPEFMKRWVEAYGDCEPHPSGPFRVTSTRTALGEHPNADLVRFDGAAARDDRIIGYVMHLLPLNGEWSDLGAEFDLLVEDDELQLVLGSILVF